MTTTGDQHPGHAQAELHARVDNDFTNHPPASDVVGTVMDYATAKFLDMAHWIVDYVPAGVEQERALAALEQCSMQTKAGIARNQEAVIATFGEPEAS